MQEGEFDELALYRAVAKSGARALLIGGRAIIAVGIPILTVDWDYWIHRDDIAPFNAALEPLDLFPSCTPDEALARGRYVLENDEKLDVMIAARCSTVDGDMVVFDTVWARRQLLKLGGELTVAVPTLDDLISTKRFSARPKDAQHVRLLRAERERRGQA